MTFQKLTTSRLTLRLIQKSDLEVIHKLQSTPEVDKYNTLGIPKNLAETEKVMGPSFEDLKKDMIRRYTFVIELNRSREFMGLIALNLGNPKYKSAEVWYKLLPIFWGQAYATEALKRILEFGFNNLKLHRIEAGCAVENLGSIKVLEKVGMTCEGRKRQTLPLKTGWSDNFEYGILEKDFKNMS
ncbi:MAG: GNAT family N-acetyltransferase [Flavobacteriaceae bacterium]|nr:GNAT family N-acetyltransferase [Flavobacteriaceae bacterium]